MTKRPKILSSKRNQLIFFIELIVLCFSLFLVLFIPPKFKDSLIESIENKNYTMTQLLSYNIESALLFNDVQAISDGVSLLARTKNFNALVVLDTNNKVIFSINKLKNYDYQGKTAPITSNYEESYNQNYIPVKFNDKILGHLVTQFSLEEAKHKITQTQHTFYIIAVSLLLIGLFGSIIIGNVFTSPLKTLQSNFNEIAELNLNKRIEVKGSDEFSTLAISFNKMADKLNTAYSEISDINKNLENTILDRTLKLKEEIEEKNEVQANLLKTNELITGIINSSPLPILTLNQNGKILSASPAYYQLIDDTQDNLYLKTLPLKDADDYNKFNYALDFASNTADSTILNVEMRNKDKDLIIRVHLSPIPTHFQQDNPKIIAILDDITERVRHSEELQNLNAELELRVENRTKELNDTLTMLQKASDDLMLALEKEKELGELKTRFISMISHEYRTPLSIILSSASIISKLLERQDFEKIQVFLDKIESSVQNMVKLLEDVLNLGKSESGSIQIQPGYINLRLILEQILSDIKTSNKYENPYNLNITGNFDEIFTDEKLITQILNNLISNAFKYSPNNNPIDIILTDKKDSFELFVRDYGIGIPEEGYQKLFDSFYRANNVGAISGTGLGMSIVKRAIDALNGTITVNSQVNKGTEFTVNIPYLSEDIQDNN